MRPPSGCTVKGLSRITAAQTGPGFHRSSGSSNEWRWEEKLTMVKSDVCEIQIVQTDVIDLDYGQNAPQLMVR
jgi:hypothetical protein